MSGHHIIPPGVGSDAHPPLPGELKVVCMTSSHLYFDNRPESSDEGTIQRAATRIHIQSAAGFVPLLTLNHLAKNAGVSHSFLHDVVSREIDPYTIIEMRKRSGGSRRKIAAPLPPLKQVQRWILDHVLVALPVHGAAFAYQLGKSAASCARQHLGARWLLKMDIKDYFHNFDEMQIFDALAVSQYAPLVRLELARIMTRAPKHVPHWLPAKYRDFEAGLTPAGPYARTSSIGYMPQGAPTSATLSNALSMKFDLRVSRIAAHFDCVYTRYADDLTFSGAGSFSRERVLALMRRVSAVAVAEGLPVRRAKTQIVPHGVPKEVLGIRVDGSSLRISARVRRRIEGHLRGAEVFGVAAHSQSRGFHDPIGFLNHLHGLVRYAHDVEPGVAGEYFSRVEALISSAPVNASS